MPPPQRRIQRILVCNRGEIAIRILQCCRELPNPPVTYALYTDNDTTHISLGRPDHAIRLPSPAGFMDIPYLVGLVKHFPDKIDAIHPGYGFLSESADFCKTMWDQAGVAVIGPGWEVLERTGDKLLAKALAVECEVPVLQAMSKSTSSVEEVASFARKNGFPIMIKSVDGGGGRGIRLVKNEQSLRSSAERCIGESPSRTVFAEQAAVNGYKHIEVQILGDGKGGIKHLWERDCSVQRRFQKIVEIAPAQVARRKVIAQVIGAAVRMARRIKYLGAGTWEFLVNVKTRKFFFLEINPRLQVEHTITECITGVDVVREQLLIAQGMHNAENLRLGEWWEADTAPSACSIQLRLCAEDPVANFSLSIGKVTDIQLPSGNGIRTDTHLARGGMIGSDFDNMMAKIIVTAPTWQEAVLKAQRALADTKVVGVKTNLNLLRAVMADKEFQSGSADTEWLERSMDRLVRSGEAIGRSLDDASSALPQLTLASPSSSTTASSNTTTLRKGNAWSLTLEDPVQGSKNSAAHHLSIDRIVRNEFPEALIAELSFTAPGAKPQQYKATVTSTSTSAEATASSHRRGDPGNQTHIVLPMSGKLVEMLVEEGDQVQENQVIAFVKQMKMELEVRSPRAGTIAWTIEMENDDGDDVAEGVLLAELVDESAKKTEHEFKSKL